MSDTHEVTKGSLGQIQNLHFTTVLNVRLARSDEKVAAQSDKFAFYQSFERPTRTKWRKGCSLWWQSWKTAITSAKFWAVFDDIFWRQASLQQNFGQCFKTVCKDSHHFSRTLGSVSRQSLKTAVTSADFWRWVSMWNRAISAKGSHSLANNSAVATLLCLPQRLWITTRTEGSVFMSASRRRIVFLQFSRIVCMWWLISCSWMASLLPSASGSAKSLRSVSVRSTNTSQFWLLRCAAALRIVTFPRFVAKTAVRPAATAGTEPPAATTGTEPPAVFEVMAVFKEWHRRLHRVLLKWCQSFKDSHHFSRTLGSVSRQSLNTAVTSAKVWAVFQDSL